MTSRQRVQVKAENTLAGVSRGLPAPACVGGFSFNLKKETRRWVALFVIMLSASCGQVEIESNASRVKIVHTEQDVQALITGLNLYRLDNGRYPTDEEGLHALVTGKRIDRIPNDAWGRSYVYRSTAGNGFELLSLGPDGRRSSDDIGVVDGVELHAAPAGESKIKVSERTLVRTLARVAGIAFYSAIGLFFYFIPSLVARARRHRHIVPIILLNVFLGFTVFWWIVALVWALLKDDKVGPGEMSR